MTQVAICTLRGSFAVESNDERAESLDLLDKPGDVSPVLYTVAIPLAFVSRWISLGLYIAVALMWLVPDRRLESVAGG